MEEYKAALEEWGAKLKAVKDGGDDPGPKPKAPVKRSFIKGDVTIEALIGALKDNPRGLLIGQDELSAWIGSFVKYAGKSGTSDLPRWLQLHHAGSINYTRKTGDPDKREVRVRGVGVSVTGTIQPKILSRVLNEEFRASGFLARLLLAMPPWRKRQWTEAEIDEATRGEFAALLEELYRLPPASWPDGRPCPHLVKLSPSAKQQFVAFYNANGSALESADEDMSAVMSKLEGYSLRFALIFHCCRLKEYAGRSPITGEDMAAAIALTRWFRDEAERVYLAVGESTELQSARHLAEVIHRLADRNGGCVTVRQLQRSNQRKYSSASQAEAVLESLVGLGFGRWVETASGPGGGPPVRSYAPCVTGDTTDEDDAGGGPDDEPDGDVLCDRTPNGDNPPPESGMGVDSASHASDGVNARGMEQSSEGRGAVSPVTHNESEPRAAPKVEGPNEGADCHTNGVLSHMDFVLITDGSRVGWVVAAVEDSPGLIGIDTETTGLDPLRDRVRLLQIATERDTFVIDLFAVGDPCSSLAPLFEVLAGRELVGHNLGFDLLFLHRLGFEPGAVFDTLIASKLLHAGERGENNAWLRHGLEDVVERELGRRMDKSQQQADWSLSLTPAMLAYAAEDARVLLPLAEDLKAKLPAAKLMEIATIEMRTVPGIAWCAPIAVDSRAWMELADSAEAEQSRLHEQMDALAPNGACLPGAESWNWNSPEDVKHAFQGLGIILESTDDDTLAGIDHPLAANLRLYRGAAKLTGTYGRKWLDNHLGADGRVLPSWNQLGAESGRMSCSDPNLQQIPRGQSYRKCFVAGPGKVLVKADYSQIELRIAAKVANEPVMIRSYRDGRDLHTLTAARLLNKPEAEVAKADRQLAKAVNFGLLYGMGWRGLKGYALSSYGVHLSDAEARLYRETFFRTYPALKAWHQRTARQLDRLVRADPGAMHQVRTLGGRRQILPVAFRREDGTYQTNVTNALNAPVQGTGADGLKAAIALLWEARNECMGARPVIYCHDEIVLEVPEPEAAKAGIWLKRCMVEAVAALIEPVPVEVEVSTGKTWGG